MRYQELQLSTNNAEVFLDNMHLTSLHISSRLPSLSAKIFWIAPWQSRLPHPQVILYYQEFDQLDSFELRRPIKKQFKTSECMQGVLHVESV